jgi:hypothetical protein
MLQIRPATIEDVALLRTMIRELAEYERELETWSRSAKKILRETATGKTCGFPRWSPSGMANPLATPLLWDTIRRGAAEDCSLKICLFARLFTVAESEAPCWRQLRALPSRKNFAEYTGKCLIGMKGRSNFTKGWELNFAINGVRYF